MSESIKQLITPSESFAPFFNEQEAAAFSGFLKATLKLRSSFNSD